MTQTSEQKSLAKVRRDKRLAAGLCTLCPRPRTHSPGYKSDVCAGCAERRRDAQRKRTRAKRGVPIDAPVKPHSGGRKPDPSIERSDEYKPQLYTPQKKRKASEILYGSLTLEDIRRATSALPLKPPGK